MIESQIEKEDNLYEKLAMFITKGVPQLGVTSTHSKGSVTLNTSP